MPRILLSLLAFCALLSASARQLYVSPLGDDAAFGTLAAPFATLRAAQEAVCPGDTVWLRGGVYRPAVGDAIGERLGKYRCAFILDKSGTPAAPITYAAYPGERPVFDLSGFRPAGQRVAVFWVEGSWLRLDGLEVVGTPVVVADGSNTQSECFSVRGGSHCVFRRLAMHHGAAIGWYLVHGAHNLVLDCDAYCNYDAANGGGNVDGFGCHPRAGDVGNVLRGCRAWWNSDDGFDLIHSGEAVRIDSCWAFYNGYRPGTFESAADGNGIKAGGYGMKPGARMAEVVPRHIVSRCLAYRNKQSGIYANHHLGGIDFVQNTSIGNRYNYNMVCRKSRTEAVDVPGYGHRLTGNLSFAPVEAHLQWCDTTACCLRGNSFDTDAPCLSAADFLSLDPVALTAPRLADGSLPRIVFGLLRATSPAHARHMDFIHHTVL